METYQHQRERQKLEQVLQKAQEHRTNHQEKVKERQKRQELGLDWTQTILHRELVWNQIVHRGAELARRTGFLRAQAVSPPQRPTSQMLL